MNLSVNQELIC